MTQALDGLVYCLKALWPIGGPGKVTVGQQLAVACAVVHVSAGNVSQGACDAIISDAARLDLKHASSKPETPAIDNFLCW